ncbi:MAG TPA: APC family permease [Candidatus Omnitrophota bacterium]|nr:APC family permease [Candidatus Omnitrophota bacterium]
MSDPNRPSIVTRIKSLFFGEARNVYDRSMFHGMSLIAFFAWVGLGADGLSSSCYGPQEAWHALGAHHYLGILIAIASAFTVFVIAESYQQIIELFPQGGGGYVVASRLLTPALGMISGCALLIDYILTITVSIASGADAIFSFLPPEYMQFKLLAAVGVLLLLIWLNMRGVKESVVPLVPIFLTFVITHAFIIIFALADNYLQLPLVAHSTASELARTSSELGMVGMLMLLVRAYSMGAGTYTGIEAVSNGMPILREPKVKTAKRTMNYMAISLAAMVLGLMFAYVFYRIEPQAGKTMNALLFERVAGGWGGWGYLLILISLISEGAILFVAAQTGFIGGPQNLSNMAMDRWMPKSFAVLSDRLVTSYGVLLMGIAALVLMIASRGSVTFMVVLYSINVFITFMLSQLGMVRHWWGERKKGLGWIKKILINGVGLVLTVFILILMIFVKFNEGGWITLGITGGLVFCSYLIKRTYEQGDRTIMTLDPLAAKAETGATDLFAVNESWQGGEPEFEPRNRTAVFIVKDFNGVGVKTIANVMNSFNNVFRNFIFVQAGLLNAGIFKESEEMKNVEHKVDSELERYIKFMNRYGYFAKGYTVTGIDVVEELEEQLKQIILHFPGSVIFGGQVVFPDDNWFSRLLHNYTLFSVQRRLYNRGVPVYVVPIRV